MGSMIATMSMAFWVLIVVIVMMSTIRRMKKKTGKISDAKRSYVSDEKLYAAGKPSVGRTKAKAAAVSRDSTESMILRDNRNSDWLAMQLREEARAKVKVSDMFQIKSEHANKCDAEFIKRFHESNCDANAVDSGLRNK